MGFGILPHTIPFAGVSSSTSVICLRVLHKMVNSLNLLNLSNKPQSQIIDFTISISQAKTRVFHFFVAT